MITKDSVLQRKKELEQQRDQQVAQLNALMGALQDCDYWLAKLGEGGIDRIEVIRELSVSPDGILPVSEGQPTS